MKYKLVAGLGAAAALLLGGAAPGSAQLVPFQGTTQACFFFSPATTCTPATSTSFSGSTWLHNNINGGNLSTTVQAPGGNLLWFTNGNFSFSVNQPGSQQFQLGKFSFNSTNPVSIVNAFFVLAVHLTAPSSNTTVFSSTITGKLKGFKAQNGVGAIQVDFDPSGVGSNWTSAPIALPGGKYTLTAIGGTYFSDAINQPVLGVATVTPEPVTMTLFGTGLGGLALLRRRRRKTAEKSDA